MLSISFLIALITHIFILHTSAVSPGTLKFNKLTIVDESHSCQLKLLLARLDSAAKVLYRICDIEAWKFYFL